MKNKNILDKFLLNDGFAEVLIMLIFCGFFSHSNFSALRIIPGIILSIILLIRFYYDIKNKSMKKYQYFFKYLVWYILFFAYSLLSASWTISTNYSFSLIKEMLYTMLFVLLILFYITDYGKLRKVTKMYIITCVYTCFLILLFNFKLYGTDLFGSVTGLYFNRIALLLCNGIFFSFFLYKSTGNRNYIVLSLLFYFVIFLTGSRKSLIMPIVFIIIFLVLNIGRNKQKFIKTSIAVVILIALSSILFISNPKLKTRMINLYQAVVQHETTTDGSIRERTYFRKTGIELFKSNPIIGIGINGFRGYLASIKYRHVTYSHCNYIELLATLGIIGFLIYYLMYSVILKNSIKKFDANNYIKLLCLSYIMVEIIFEYGFVSFYFFEIQSALMMIYLYSNYGNRKDAIDENRNYDSIAQHRWSRKNSSIIS